MLAVLKSCLRRYIATGLPDKPGFLAISMPLEQLPECGMLDWLGAQTLFPQFYWQHRDTQAETAVCGQLCQFNSLTAAHAFLHSLPDDQRVRLWGLNGFDQQPTTGAGSHLFLPRLIWHREGRQHSLTLNLYSDVSLSQDALQAQQFLASFRPAPVLRPLPSHCLSIDHLPARQAWQQLIAKALTALSQGSLQKVVLARRSELTFEAAIPAASLMAASRRVNHGCYHYMLAWSADRAFLGSSPERLWHRVGRQLQTEALAGSAAAGDTPARSAQLADWLLQDGKNQRENLLVVDDICQRLQQAAQQLDISAPEVISLRTVQHLRRTISGHLQQPDDVQCLQLLQPTAAVAGLPRASARAFIHQNEPFARDWYAGSAGSLGQQESEFCVSLRCAHLAGRRVWLYAGAGIIEGSDAALEWQEVENKAAGMQTLFSG